MGKVVVVGSSNTDMVVKVPHLPAPGETVLGTEFQIAAGGKGANQAVAAARADGRVTLIASIGKDSFGEEALRGFMRDGINIDLVFRVHDAPSGVALIMVDEQGENSIAVATGANGKLLPKDIEPFASTLGDADVVVLQLEIPLETVEAAARIASEQGTCVILNPAPAQELPDALLKHVSILTPNESEVALLTGVDVSDEAGLARAATVLRERGVRNVLITLGARGTYVAADGTEQVIPSFEVKAVDTTAAGDVFNGALAADLAEGKDLLEAVRFASAAAALSVTKIGAQPSAPNRAEIHAFMDRAVQSSHP